MFPLDADAGVLDAESRAVGTGTPCQAHFAARRRVADGIAHQVAEGARQLGIRAQQVVSRRLVQPDAVAAGGERLGIAAYAAQQACHRDPLLARRLRRGLQRGQHEQVI
ncbi:hypothetical protein D3C83_16460 [compost metagenome]